MRVIYDYQITLVTTLVLFYFRIEIIKMQYLRYYIRWFLKKGYYIHWVQVNPTAHFFFFFGFLYLIQWQRKKVNLFPFYWIQLYLVSRNYIGSQTLIYINEAYILAHIIIWNKAKFPSDFHLQYCCETELFFFHI